jgi:hypothetical protein
MNSCAVFERMRVSVLYTSSFATSSLLKRTGNLKDTTMDSKRKDSAIGKDDWTFDKDTEEKWKKMKEHSNIHEGEAKAIRRQNERRTPQEVVDMVNKSRKETWQFTMSRLQKTSQKKDLGGSSTKQSEEKGLTASRLFNANAQQSQGAPDLKPNAIIQSCFSSALKNSSAGSTQKAAAPVTKTKPVKMMNICDLPEFQTWYPPASYTDSFKK